MHVKMQDLLLICPLLASHPDEVATALNRLLLHAMTLQLQNPLIMQQVQGLVITEWNNICSGFLFLAGCTLYCSPAI